jgi:hypothetical protein
MANGRQALVEPPRRVEPAAIRPGDDVVGGVGVVNDGDVG